MWNEGKIVGLKIILVMRRIILELMYWWSRGKKKYVIEWLRAES